MKESTQQKMPLEGRVIVYLEPDEMTRTLVSRMLTKRGAKVIAVGEHEAAYKACKVKSPHAIVAGQGLDGQQAKEFITNIQSYIIPGTPLVAYADEKSDLAGYCASLITVPSGKGFGVLAQSLETVWHKC